MLTLALDQAVVAALLGVLFLAVSVVLILTVLIQRPQGGGLSGAFGAGGSGETAFGARTGDALTIATISFFVIWLCVAVALVYATRPADLTATPASATSTNPTETDDQPATGAGEDGGAAEAPPPGDPEAVSPPDEGNEGGDDQPEPETNEPPADPSSSDGG